MVALYITSSAQGSGKTTVIAGLGKHLLGDGQKVGFFKPVMADHQHQVENATDSDTIFIKHIFALAEPVDQLSPVFPDESHLASNIKDAYARVSQGKDVVIIEGVSDQPQLSRTIVDSLKARVILVAGYAEDYLKVIKNYQNYGQDLLGIVLNKVPGRRLESVSGELATRMDKAGVKVLGLLPEDRSLFTLTIGEMVEHIHGEILSGAERSGELVENIMLGAMCVDSGPYYFGHKDNKVAVIRTERPDMQLAAMETSIRGLVIAGDKAPNPTVLSQAAAKKVPVILARANINTLVNNIEATLGQTRFNQESKLARLNEIMAKHFSFPVVYKGLGLTR